MSLLPALFQNTDPMPMALGAKIVAPVPKKPDPFKAFEKGVHARDGKVTPATVHRPGDYVEPWRTPTLAERRAAVGMPPIGVKVPVGETVEFFNPELQPTLTPTALDALRLQSKIRAEVIARIDRDEQADPRQNAIAAKMAEVQRQKQELRALTRKDTKR